jgi:hypothetical protein
MKNDVDPTISAMSEPTSERLACKPIHFFVVFVSFFFGKLLNHGTQALG